MKESTLYRVVSFLFEDLCEGHIVFNINEGTLEFSCCGKNINEPIVSIGTIDSSGKVSGRLISVINNREDTFTNSDLPECGEWGSHYIASDLFMMRSDTASYFAVKEWLGEIQ